MIVVHVIWWRYSDGSSAGVFRAYADKQRAEEDMELIEHSIPSKDYELVTLPLIGIKECS